ncbi:MAG: MFS transporter, partial [Phototrophicaceae bacterium]
PQSATQKLKAGENVVSASFRQLGATFRDLSQYRELFKYLIAFLIYNDGIGTIIGVATIYGAELGFQTTELILALLLVQFVGIPFSFIFGVLPNPESKRRSGFLAFIVFNAVALPIVGVALRYTLPVTVTGAPVPDYTTVGDFRGQGDYAAPTFITGDVWQTQAIDGALLDADADVQYVFNIGADAAYEIPFNGQRVDFTYAMGADFGIFALELDGAPFLDDDGQPQTIDTYSANARYGLDETIDAPTPGQHTLRLVNTGEANPASSGNQLGFGTVTVKPPVRGGNLLMILGALLAVQAAGALFAVLGGWRLLKPLADSLNTKRSIILSLVVYCMIAIWGFFLNSTVEFWFLAWMVGIVQGGSQALSRSMYAGMTPASKSGEFFGLFAIMEKFSAIIGPLLFALAVGIFGNSRPAILSLIALFIIGGYLLTRVDVEAGRKLAHEENARLAGES